MPSQRGPAVTPAVTAVRRAAADRPGWPAVRADDGDLDYGQLVARAEAVAGALRAAGIGPGSRVGVCAERSAALVVAVVGVAWAGAAYVAIDPAYPGERIRWMLADSGAAALVHDKSYDAGFSGPALPLGPGGHVAGRPPYGPAGDHPLPGVTIGLAPPDDQPAYVVYTSGSTGRPKGSVVGHGGLNNLVSWHVSQFGLSGDDHCTQLASPGFDAAVWEMWPALAVGATLHVVPSFLRTDPVGLRDWMVERGITVSFVPTAVAETLLGLKWPADTALRFLLTGGDALTRRPPPGLPFSLINNYGLSETTVVATSGPVAPSGPSSPTIGRPIPGVVAEVVDAGGRPVGAGEAGELVIGGAALALGYTNPADAQGRFFGAGAGRRYRTGDVVRWGPDGDLEFVGRTDDQISIRGFRVEPGEVSAVLGDHPDVAASVTVAIGGAPLDRRLAAYLVAAGVRHPPAEELDGWLERLLPDYMIPSHYVWMEQLPLTIHGKVDRSALPDPGPQADQGAPASTTGASNGTDGVEATIAGVVAELLGVDAVGRDDNFFLLGGHSMLGAQLIVRVEDRFGVELSLRRLFDHPSVAGIAAEVRAQLAGGGEG
jgi:amino acid adenylation domain-containing protein